MSCAERRAPTSFLFRRATPPPITPTLPPHDATPAEAAMPSDDAPPRRHADEAPNIYAPYAPRAAMTVIERRAIEPRVCHEPRRAYEPPLISLFTPAVVYALLRRRRAPPRAAERHASRADMSRRAASRRAPPTPPSQPPPTERREPPMPMMRRFIYDTPPSAEMPSERRCEAEERRATTPPPRRGRAPAAADTMRAPAPCRQTSAEPSLRAMSAAIRQPKSAAERRAIRHAERPPMPTRYAY